MKKILLLSSAFLILMLASCGPVQKKGDRIEADKGNFIVQAIDKVGLDDDSTGVLCRYEITSDTLLLKQGAEKQGQPAVGQNPFCFFLVDTSGKYQVGDTLQLKLKPTNPY
jgi:hypothetical protein